MVHFLTVFLATNSLSQNISITLLQISLKLHEHRGCNWRKKLPWMIFEEQFLVPRYTAASKIGNSVISLLWQLRCRCNPDHNKFPSSSNTTVVAIFPKLCLWRRSLCSNLGGIDPEKLYRATLSWACGRLSPWKSSKRQIADLKGPSLLRKLERPEIKKRTYLLISRTGSSSCDSATLWTVFHGRVARVQVECAALHEEAFQYQAPLWRNRAIHEANAK